MKVFWMYRGKDESGVSGTGKVLQGIQFDSGLIVVQWLVDPFGLGVYKSWTDFNRVHVDSHPSNETKIMITEIFP